jgi:hypothetical protein
MATLLLLDTVNTFIHDTVSFSTSQAIVLSFLLAATNSHCRVGQYVIINIDSG